MRKLFYVGLEPYQARYTLQLTDWNIAKFEDRGIDYHIVEGKSLDSTKQIHVGQVLDAHGRGFYALSQMMELIRLHREGEIVAEDVIFFEDMFHPGIESLPYIFNQMEDLRAIPGVYVRCLAQSIDPDDFVNSTGMAKWMRPYENMVANWVDGILASNEEMCANLHIAGVDQCPIYNISGLAFGKEEVRSRVSAIKNFEDRKRRVIFAARWDTEKQPFFFLDLAKQFESCGVEFAILSGGTLRSNDARALEAARKMSETSDYFKIYENLTKDEYYEIVNDSRVMFNCALQDWTSNTVSEADALGCNVVFPAYRSFPEVFANDHTRMYVPWSLEDAKAKVMKALYAPSEHMGKISDWTDGTIDRILDIMQHKGESWNRTWGNYRRHVSKSNYA